jgi:Inner membrane protein import complex subunit Tim54
MPRKVTIYIAPPPGDAMDKSRVWFREYVKVNCITEVMTNRVYSSIKASFFYLSLCCIRLLWTTKLEKGETMAISSQ